MKITEVRKIYGQNPNTIWAVIKPENQGYSDEMESKQVSPSKCLRVRLVSLTKYYSQYGSRFTSVADAQLRGRVLAESEKSFGYLCQVFDDQNLPTNEYVVIPSRNSWIGELTPEIETWWAGESVRELAIETERNRRNTLHSSATKMVNEQADAVRVAIMKTTIAVLKEQGLDVPKIKVDVSGRITDWGSYHDLNKPYEVGDIKTEVIGEVSMGYDDFQRLLEIVYASKERMNA